MTQTTLGQRIAARRKELGLTQSALGEQLGVSRQSIFKWESDAAIPEIDKLISLSRLFGVSIGWLLGLEQEPRPGTQPEQPPEDFTPRERELLERLLARQPAAPRWQKWAAAAGAVCCAAALALSGIALVRAELAHRELKEALVLLGQTEALFGLTDVDLVSEFRYDCVPTADMTEAEVTLEILPHSYDGDNRCTVAVLLNNQTLAEYPCVWNGSRYEVSFSLEAADGYRLLFQSEDPSGSCWTDTLEGTVLERLASNMSWSRSCQAELTAVFYDDSLLLQELRLDIPLPRVFRDQTGIWERCDLVLTREDGTEMDRIDLLNRSAYSAGIDFAGADVNLMTRNHQMFFEKLAQGDELMLSVECGLTTGHQFRHTVCAWEQTADGMKRIQ